MKKLLVSLALVLSCVAFASAAPIEFTTAGIKMDTPRNWKYTIPNDGSSIQVDSPDGLVSIVFIPLDDDASSMDVAFEAAFASILESSPDAEFGDPEEISINGITGIEMIGSGTIDGENVDIAVDVLLAKVPIMVVAYIANGGHKHDKTIDTFISTIKKK